MGDDPDAALVVERLARARRQRSRSAGGALLGGAAPVRDARRDAAARSSSSRTSTGPSRRCSTSSSTSAAGAATRRSSSSASRGPSCSRSGRGGRARSCGSSRSRPTRRRELLDALDGGGILSPELARARRRGGAGQSALRRAARGHARRRGARCSGARRAAADDPGAARRPARPPRRRSSGTCSSGRPSSARSSGRGAVAALGGGDEALGPTLLGLVRRELVEPAVSSIPGEDGFRFRHALIRDAAYAGDPEADARRPPRALRRLARAPRRPRTSSSATTSSRPTATATSSASLDDHTRSLGERAGELLTAAGRARAGPRRRAGGGQPPRARGCAAAADERLARVRPPRPRDRAHALGRLRSRRGRARGGSRPRAAPRATGGSSCARSSSASSSGSSRTRETPAEEITRIAEEAIPALEALGDDAGVAKAWHLLSEPPVNACRWGERAAALEHALELRPARRRRSRGGSRRGAR